MCGPFSMPQASPVLPANSEATGGRGETDERVAEGKPGSGLPPTSPSILHPLSSKPPAQVIDQWPGLHSSLPFLLILS